VDEASLVGPVGTGYVIVGGEVGSESAVIAPSPSPAPSPVAVMEYVASAPYEEAEYETVAPPLDSDTTLVIVLPTRSSATTTSNSSVGYPERQHASLRSPALVQSHKG